jgi:hypothetical protein
MIDRSFVDIRYILVRMISKAVWAHLIYLVNIVPFLQEMGLYRYQIGHAFITYVISFERK